MKALLILLLTFVASVQVFSADLGPQQANRILSVLSKQKDGDVAYYAGSLLNDTPPYLVQVSALKFALRPVIGHGIKDRFNKYFHPRYELIINDAKTGKYRDTLEAGNLYILKNDKFVNLRALTKLKTDGSDREQYNSVLFSGCTELQKDPVDGELNVVTICNVPQWK